MESGFGHADRMPIIHLRRHHVGFIATPDGTEYFFQQSACTSTPFDSMREGENVTFAVGQDPKRPRAENVKPA